MENLTRLQVLNGLIRRDLMTWEDVEYELELIEKDLKTLETLREEVVRSYDLQRNTKGRLSETMMENLMLITTVIDLEIVKLGGEV